MGTSSIGIFLPSRRLSFLRPDLEATTRPLSPITAGAHPPAGQLRDQRLHSLTDLRPIPYGNAHRTASTLDGVMLPCLELLHRAQPTELVQQDGSRADPFREIARRLLEALGQPLPDPPQERPQ